MTRFVFKKYPIFTGAAKYAFFAGIDKIRVHRRYWQSTYKVTVTRFVFKKYPIFTGVDKVPICRKCRPRKIPKKYRFFAGFDKYLPHLSTSLKSIVTVFRKCWTRKVPALCWTWTRSSKVLTKYPVFSQTITNKIRVTCWRSTRFSQVITRKLRVPCWQSTYYSPFLQIIVPICWKNNCFSITS